jgi:hypothetical protein
MMSTAEVTVNFAEYIAFSNTWGVKQHAVRGFTIELKGRVNQAQLLIRRTTIGSTASGR